MTRNKIFWHLLLRINYILFGIYFDHDRIYTEFSFCIKWLRKVLCPIKVYNFSEIFYIKSWKKATKPLNIINSFTKYPKNKKQGKKQKLNKLKPKLQQIWMVKYLEIITIVAAATVAVVATTSKKAKTCNNVNYMKIFPKPTNKQNRTSPPTLFQKWKRTWTLGNWNFKYIKPIFAERAVSEHISADVGEPCRLTNNRKTQNDWEQKRQFKKISSKRRPMAQNKI